MKDIHCLQCPSPECNSTDFSLIDDKTYESEQIYECRECGVAVGLTVL